MSNPRQSLNRMVPWNQLLDLLGAKIRAMGLPTRCQCPLCQDGVLRVDEDSVVGGQWFSCQRCGKNGDMIELAAAVWNLDIPATVVRLARHGLMLPIEPKATTRYEQQHVQYRQRLNGLWKEAQAGRIFRSHTLQKLFDRLGLHWGRSEQAWHNGPGRLIGGIDKVSVESCFAPQVMKHAQARRQQVNPSARAVFRGGGWSDVLTIPLYDLPGRICAYVCIGREADPAEDFVLKCANFGFAGNQHCSPPVEARASAHLTVSSVGLTGVDLSKSGPSNLSADRC